MTLIEKIEAILEPTFVEYDVEEMVVYANTMMDLLRESLEELKKHE